MKKHEAVELVPDAFISITIGGNMVAVAGIFMDDDASPTFDVGVGIADPEEVEAVCSLLAAAIAAFRDADWQLVLPLGDADDETETPPPF